MRSLRASASWLQRRRTTVASWAALAAIGGGLIVYAIGSDGQTTHRADLNDGGVWVTNQAIDALARQNKPIRQLDVLVPSGSDGVAADADVLQDGSAVVSVAGEQLIPVDPALGKALTDSAVESAGPASLAGGTIAAVDPKDGRVWASRVDTTQGVSGLAGLAKDSKPLARVGADSALTVTRRGAVVAVSGGGDGIILKPTATGFADAEEFDLATPADGVAQLSAVGDTPVILDGQGRVLVGEHEVEVANAAQVSERSVQLQQPGPDAADVLVATGEGLWAISVEKGTLRQVADASGSQVVAPVVVGECGFAVWADGAAAAIVSACAGDQPDGPTSFAVQTDAELVFRVNRNQVVLNDITNGSVWSVDAAKPVQIADWQAITPQKKEDSKSDDEDDDTREVRQPPKANPDNLGARASGRATVLHVLDNDLVSGGGVLTISKVEQPKQAGVRVQISPDRQTLLLTLPRDFTGSPSFSYTIDDGSGGKDATADGRVTVRARAAGDPGSAAPTRRPGATDPVLPMAATGAIEVSVLGDWRDNEFGDPVSVDIAKLTFPEGLEGSATADGLIRVRGAGFTGRGAVKYQVSTGGAATTGSVRLNVLGPASRKVEPPQPQPDVASGQVGGAIVVSPLDNDLPGADPSEPTARLEIAASVAPTRGLSVETDLQSGRVTARAKQPGRYQLDYTVGFGAAKRVASTITIVVEPASEEGEAPIPAPDTATAYGTSPVVVDVLANDFDPKGRVLSVLNASPATDDSGLEVAVVDSRWLRISAVAEGLAPATQDLVYTVSNGDSTATSSVSVTQKPPLPVDKNVPITTADDAIVRAGDSALIPVLDNDSTPSGDPIALKVGRIDGVPLGELSVQPALGRAYVSGRNIRYVAPPLSEIDGAVPAVEVTYGVENTTNLASASGVLRIQITPEPSDDVPNQVPTPRPVEGRVVQGDEITLRLPLVGNDPDGDSVSLVGLAQAPKLGRLLSIGANSMVYQAFPGATGTDDFRFVVEDAYGAIATGSARVAVTRAGAPQAPVAINDVVTAAPGRSLEIDVLANDFRTPGTALKLLPLESAPDGVSLDGGTQLVRATASENTRTSLSVPYRISSGFDESAGELQIRSEQGFNNPPVVEDAYAKLDGDADEVVVAVLDTAYDIDGEGAPVTLDSVGGVGTTFDSGGKATVPLRDAPQVVPFRVIDGEGATSSAVIYVPARRSGTPYLKDDAAIQVDPGESVEVPIADLVADPEQDKVFLTIAEQIIAAPAEMLSAAAPDNATLKLTATKDGRGPAAVTFEVADREAIDDPERHVAVLTVPVTIGGAEALATCPQETITVVEGGASRALDIATICHVWTPEPALAAGLDYSADWASGQEIPGVRVRNTDAGVEVKAAVDVKGEPTGLLEVSINGKPAIDASGKRATLQVKVVAAGPPSLRAMRIDAEADETVTVNVASYGKSPFGAAAKWVLVGKPSKNSVPGPTKVTTQGTKISITPSTYGLHTFGVSLADNGDATGNSRPRADGIITVAVVSAPAAIKDLRWDQKVQDGAVTLLWTPPSTGGGAISGYTVSHDGGSTTCPSSRCTITGLSNAKHYTFTVVAHNQYGDGEPSNKATATPDRVPDAVLNPRVVQQLDGQVNLEWTRPRGDFSDITDYYVTWPGSGSIQRSAGRTSFSAKGLANGVSTAFQIWAINETGQGPKVSVMGEGAGKPEVPALDAPGIANPTDPAQKAVTISWSAVGPNGPGPVEYFVTKTGGKQVCAASGWTQATSCTDSLQNDGSITSYTVRARNAEATAGRAPASNYTTAESAPKQVEAAAPPDGVKNLKAVATGTDGQTRVTFDVGASHGKDNVIHCSPGCGNLGSTSVSTAGASGKSFVLGGLSDGGVTTIRLWTCNGSSGGAQTGSACSAKSSDGTRTFGPLGTPSVSVDTSGECFNWDVSGNANGKQATMRLSTSGYSRSWTFTKTQSASGSYCPGYDETRKFTVKIDDTGSTAEQPQDRGSKQDTSGNKTTPHPPPSVVVKKGPKRVVDIGSNVCTTPPGCPSVIVTTAHFSGTAHCEVTAATYGTDFAGFERWNQGANETRTTELVQQNGSITVRCRDNAGGSASDQGNLN